MQMRKSLYLTLALVALLLLVVKLTTLAVGQFMIPKAYAGLKITSQPPGAEVYLDNTLKGKTPYEEGSLKTSTVLIKVVSSKGTWEGKVVLNSGTWTVIQRDLSADPQTQAGENMTLQKGEGVTVISSPDGALLEVDGKTLGQTPLKISTEEGVEHLFVIQKGGFNQRSIKVAIPEGFHLTINVDLALDDRVDLTNVALTPQSTSSKVKILSTPTNFLRVRDKPNLAGKELTRVEPGDELVLLGEEGSWYKVRLSNGLEGYITSAYAEKITQ